MCGLPSWCSGKEFTCNAGDTKTGVHSLGQEDPLKQEMVTHFSSLAQRIPWTEEPCGALWSPWGHKELDMTE